jgi:thioredoxin 1
MVTSIHNYEEYQSLIHQEKAILVYFSHDQCNVCKVLRPKIANLLSDEFPKMNMYYVDTVELPLISGQERIFAVPTLIVFFEGKEYIRKSRNIGLDELRREIERPYHLMFED